MATRSKLILTAAEANLLSLALTTQGEFLETEEVEPFASLRHKLAEVFGIDVGADVVEFAEKRLARLRQGNVPQASCRTCGGDGRRWDARKGRFDDTQPCSACSGTGNDVPSGATIKLPKMRVELGESRYGSPEPRLILTWAGKSRDVPHAMMMIVIHATVARIWAVRPPEARWLVNAPHGGEDRQGRAQATITVETVSGSTIEAKQAVNVLRRVAGARG